MRRDGGRGDDAIRAVVLAAGHGRRMRAADPTADLTPAQAAAADRGVKGLVPVGRPFLDYALGALADAGIREVCLVVAPGHAALRDRYAETGRRLTVRFAVQERPRGTADALLQARAEVGEEPFLVVNSDNYYPAPVLHRLATLGGPGLVAFRARDLVSGGNVDAERLAGFALVETDGRRHLRGIREKPELGGPPPGGRLISMNCWRFGPGIFAACEAVRPSARGELELPSAVAYAVERLGERFRVAVAPAGSTVLDLSHRRDVKAVTEHLAGIQVDL